MGIALQEPRGQLFSGRHLVWDRISVADNQPFIQVYAGAGNGPNLTTNHMAPKLASPALHESTTVNTKPIRLTEARC